jgi:hypothetical protein
LSLASLTSLVYCLWARPGAYPREEYLKGSSIGKASVFPTNIRLGWKGFPGANTQAFCKNSQLTALKSFITLDPGAFVINIFTAVIYKCTY